MGKSDKQGKAKRQQGKGKQVVKTEKAPKKAPTQEVPSQANDQEDEPMNDIRNLDSDFENLSDDEPSSKREKRYREPELSDWTRAIIEAFITQHGEEIKKELQEANPDFSKIKSLLGRLNEAITNANREHQAPQELNIVRVDVYQQTYDAWKARVNSDHVKGNTKEEWKAYYELRKMFRLINRQNHLPEEWNIPSATAEQLFGAKPSGIEELPDDAESAASYSDESESEESESDEVEGIDALEARMRKEYSSLSRGKVLYWWPVGMGTQIFVRYGPKKSPIYRVRAGSSLPYDPRSTEQVLSKTRGNAKIRVQAEGTVKEVWKYTRDDVQDIIGVGWKVEDDDDTSANALAFIRPAKDIIYPHTRVLVKWKLGAVSLERRGFVRRITNGGGLSGDRMIYLKAREMENAYWGYDVEEEETDDETSESEDSSSDESSYTRSRRARRSIRTHPKRSDKNEQSDADSETSPSDQEQAPRRSKRLNRKKRGKSSRAKKDVDKEIRRLTEELTRLKLKQRGRQTSRRDRT